jgi:hypothetical protein
MNIERAQVGWRFWLWWVLVSTVGMTMGLFVGFLAGGITQIILFSEQGVVGEVLNFTLIGAIFGAILGTNQRYVLRRSAPQFGGWVLASTVGWAVGAGSGWAVGAGSGWDVDLVVGGEGLIFTLMLAVGGASVGIAQWLVLRRQVARAGWWVFANTVMGGALGWAVDLVKVKFRGQAIGLVFLLPVFGVLALVVYGAITGGVLFWLLRQSATKELDPSQTAE